MIIKIINNLRNKFQSLNILLMKSFIIFFIFISNSLCDLSISKLNKDILSEFNYYKPANFLNTTHFSCDNGTNIFPAIKFNDDFCDCIDGADENSIIKYNQILNKYT